VVNDIRAAVEHVQAETGSGPVNVIGASFGGGITAFYASRYPETVRRLVLFNPLLNYKRRFVDEKPYWHDDHIDEAAGGELAAQGFAAHSPSFKLGRPLLNEVFYLEPHRVLADIATPTLIVHGTGDTFIPVQSSREAVSQFGGQAKLIEIDGAQHGTMRSWRSADISRRRTASLWSWPLVHRRGGCHTGGCWRGGPGVGER
jgi:pimeloyl-ACP methyl ester carboxylesterase